MASLKPLRDELKKTIRTEITAVGFRYYKKIYVKDIASDVWGSFGFGISSYSAEQKVLLFPSVGVAHFAVEQLVHEWQQRPFEKRNMWLMSTTGSPLASLTPNDDNSWYFSPDEEVMPGVREIANIVAAYAVPWMEQLSDLRALLQCLLDTRGIYEHKYFAIPAVYLLLDEKENARRYIRETLDMIEQKGPNYFWSAFSPNWPENYRSVMPEI